MSVTQWEDTAEQSNDRFVTAINKAKINMSDFDKVRVYTSRELKRFDLFNGEDDTFNWAIDFHNEPGFILEGDWDLSEVMTIAHIINTSNIKSGILKIARKDVEHSFVTQIAGLFNETL